MGEGVIPYKARQVPPERSSFFRTQIWKYRVCMKGRENLSFRSIQKPTFLTDTLIFTAVKKKSKRSGFEISIIFKIKGSAFTAVVFYAKLHFKYLLYCFLTIFIYFL